MYMNYRVLSLIKRVNTQYNLIFRDNCFLLKIVEASFIILNEALTLFIIYCLSNNILKFYEMNNYLRLLIIVVSFFIIHYIIGIVLLFYNNLKGRDSLGKVLTGDFLISLFIITTSLFFIILFYRETIKTFAISFLIGDIASYMINVKLLIMFLVWGRRKNSNSLYSDSFIPIFVTALVIVFMFIMNLFIGVVVVDGVDPSSFSSCPGVFDLFYYTIVTFTTIGFGDIVPLTRAAKFMAVLISISSILCLSVFIGSIYSIRNK